MSYQHTLVSALDRLWIDEQGNLIRGHKTLQPVMKKSDWPTWLDDIPVVKEVYDFAMALRKRVPAIKFGVTSSSTTSILTTGCQFNTHVTGEGRTVNLHTYLELVVYLPGQKYVLGRIGFKDYGITEFRPAYGVMSRKIRNKKIRQWQDQHNMSMTGDLNRAVKIALTNLIPYTLMEESKETYDLFRGKVNEVGEEIASAYKELVNDCTKYNVVEKELRNLVRQGVSFVTPEFIKASQQISTAESEMIDNRMRPVKCYYITLREAHNAIRAEVVTFKGDVRVSVLWPSSPTHTSIEVTSVPMDDIPDDIRAKLAVMMSVSDGSYTPGIGYKVDSTTYWVERSGTEA